jgi:predicted  nucleic acid-binding Zn-ribbon protein
MSQPRQLYNLQQIDSQLDSARSRITEIEKILSDYTALQQAKAQAENAEKAFQQAQIALKHAEQDVETQQTKIANNERTLYSGSVTNPKELEDLQLESAALKRHLVTLEDKQLECMLALEDATSVHESAQSNLESTEEQAAKENVELTDEKTSLLADVETFEAQRVGAAAPIDPKDMQLYLKLRETRHGRAVAEVKDNSCSACGYNLTAAQAQAARSPSKVTTCDSCRRILYSK